MEYIYLIIYSIVLVSTLIYIWHDLDNKKIIYKNEKMYITLISLIIISILNYFFVDKFIKIILITIVFMIFYKYLFNSSIKKCIVVPIFYQIIIMISETIYIGFATIIFGNNSTEIISSCFGTLTTNISIAIISVLISKMKFVKKTYYKLINFTDNIKTNKLFIISLIIIIVANILAVATYYKFDFKYILIVNALITLICSIIIYYIFRVQSNYNKVYDKYNIAQSSLKEYEEMMNKYRISNHENKNLLLTVRAMIVNKEKEIPSYIDSIIEEKYEDDEKLLFEVSRIPIAGLKATIYTEILKIQRNKINYIINVDKKISTIDFIELDNKEIISLCKIMGVLIDNAIEEVKKFTGKNKAITILIYGEDKKIFIKVSNIFKSSIDVNKIFDAGYSTKGTGHGYGLALVKEIIDDNPKFNNQIEINKNIFSNIISIEYKKN